jgi:polyisoprenoid-binding protein YceI
MQEACSDAPAYHLRIRCRGTFMRISKYLRHALAMVALGLIPAASAQVHSMDTSQSKLHVYAFKSGLFSGLADNHDVEAPIAAGTIDETASRVRFVIDARQMKVLDPKLSSEKRRQVQERMLGPEVLDPARYPQITFESTHVDAGGQNEFLVTGQLSLHGVTRPVNARVRKENGRYVGTCTLKQRDFGITPISIAGGTVKVKDELKIEFDIRSNSKIAAVNK